MLHHSSAQEAASEHAGPAGESPQATVFTDILGPGAVMYASDGHLMLKGVDVIRSRHVFHRVWVEGESLRTDGRAELAIENPFSSLYTILDFEDCFWSFTRQVLHRICPDSEGLREVLAVDLLARHPNLLDSDDLIVGMNPLYHSPGLIDLALVTSGLKEERKNDMLVPHSTAVKVMRLRVFRDGTTDLLVRSYPGENVSNNLAVDPEDGIYLLTNKHAVKLREGGTGLEEIWSIPYESGPVPTPVPCAEPTPLEACALFSAQQNVRFSDGSGTTPTLMGPDSEVLVFMDGARPMRLIALRTSDGSPLDVDESVPFSDPRAQTENTIAAYGDTFVVESNSSKGVAAYRLDAAAGRVRLLWKDESLFAPNAVPLVSGASRQAYIYEIEGDDAWASNASWYVTALDLDMGSVLWRAYVGRGFLSNSGYAPLTLDDRRRVTIVVAGGLAVVQ